MVDGIQKIGKGRVGNALSKSKKGESAARGGLAEGRQKIPTV